MAVLAQDAKLRTQSCTSTACPRVHLTDRTIVYLSLIAFQKNTVEMYERGLNLILEGEKQKHAKKAELFKSMMEAKPSVQHRWV